MTMTRFVAVLCVVAGVAACKKKETNPAPAAGSAAVASGGAEPVKPAEPTPPAAAAPSLIAGEPKLGCVGWSDATKSAACITGMSDLGSMSELQLTYIGGKEAPVNLGSEGSAKFIAGLNEALAKQGYVAITGERKEMAEGKPLEVGKVTFTATSKQTSKGGENQPPTYQITVTAKCGGKPLDLFKDKVEGGSANVAARAIGDHVVAEVTIHVGREGESSDSLEAHVIDSTSCKVTSAPPAAPAK